MDAAYTFAYQVQQELRQTIQAVQLQVRQNYNAALLAQQLVEVSVQSRVNAEKLLSDAQQKLRYGTGTRFEVLRAEVRVGTREAEIIQRQNEARLALTRLLNVMGVSQLSDAQLTDKLRYEAMEVSKTACLENAMRNRTELLIGETMIRLARDNVVSEQAGNRPKVYLQGLYMRSYPGR